MSAPAFTASLAPALPTSQHYAPASPQSSPRRRPVLRRRRPRSPPETPSDPTAATPLPPSPRAGAIVVAQAVRDTAVWNGAGKDASIQRRRKVLLQSLSRWCRNVAVQAVYHPARATGSAYEHPVAAGATVACDVADVILQCFPPGHAHAVIALVLHLLMDLLLASPN